MSRFTSHESIAAYPIAKFYINHSVMRHYVEFSVDYKVTPLIPHICMLVHPNLPGAKPSGADEHYHIPLTLRDAKRLRDWLTTYINDREEILR